jgi:hypothetical protein
VDLNTAFVMYVAIVYIHTHIHRNFCLRGRDFTHTQCSFTGYAVSRMFYILCGS